MIIIDVPQGSDAWVRARLGLPTASNFDRIVTRTGKPSASADRYVARLACEWFLGYSLDETSSEFMQRGTDMEAEAVAAYDFERDVEAVKVGLCLTDDRRAGASPDRLIGADGLLEIKCPSAEIQMMYVLDGPPSDYFVQVQGQLWVTGRAWCDLRCHHPTLPHVTQRYGRDDAFIATLAAGVGKFADRLAAAKERLADAKAEREAALRDDVPAELST